MKLVDLHTHSTYSDGSCSPRELMRLARGRDLVCLSVTDHDTVSGCRECREEAEEAGIEFIPGIEMSAEFSPGTLHILGYFIRPEDPELQAKVRIVQEGRSNRNPQIIAKLNQLGFALTMEDVFKEVSYEPDLAEGRQIGRPHIAAALLKKGYVRSFEEAFDRYLGKGCPAYVDRRRLTHGEIIRAIRDSGGVAVAAHPKQMKLEGKALEDFIRRMVDEGLEGLEVYSSSHRVQEVRLYQDIAKRFHLVQTGGSDFHGMKKPDVELGYVGKDFRVEYKAVEALRETLDRRKS